MDSSGSDDYELMPKEELDTLRREVSSLKRNSVSDGDKIRVLIESMDRLTISMNRLITILDDAEKDIIDEYQKSKPTEKLNQLLEQNEMIARALIAISDNFINNNSNNSRNVISTLSQQNVNTAPSPRPIPQMSQVNRGMLPNSTNNPNSINSPNNMNNFNNTPNMNTFAGANASANNMNNTDVMSSMNNLNNNTVNAFNNNNPFPPMGSQSTSSLDDLPPMDTLPPLNDPVPAPKKKFLGIM